ncbi:hypothetical protein JCM17823_22210 [Halorubrum gandharaense]
MILGDEVRHDAELFLSPADSLNGQAYAELEDDEIAVEIRGLNPSAETVVDDLLVVAYAGAPESDANADKVWIDHDAEEVTVYRMDTGEPVDGEADAFALEPEESVTLGLLVDAGEPGVVLESVTLHAEESPVSSGGGGGGTPDFGVRASLSETAVDPGGEVVVYATLYNEGDARGTFEPTLYADGEPVAEASTSLAVDEERPREFAVTFEEPGEYELRLANTTVGTVTVGDDGAASGTANGGSGAGTTETPTATPEPTEAPTATPAEGAVAAEVIEPETEAVPAWLLVALLALTAVGYGVRRIRS